jgi:hypothetical protein
MSTPPIQPVQDEKPPGYVKLAMRNMVRKRGTSLKHFALTLLGMIGLLILLSLVFRA